MKKYQIIVKIVIFALNVALSLKISLNTRY